MLTDKFKELKILISESYTELKKVVWPTKNETIQTALIVIVMVTITGIILWLLDNFMIWLIAKLARIG
jgi:preprotein translocase subunit SecE